MTIMKQICDVPVELLSLIFKFLSRKDLLSVILVCSQWKELGEPSMFWKDFVVHREHVRIIEDVLAIRRLRNLKTIKFNKLRLNNASDNAIVFNAIAQKQSVKELVIIGSDFSKVSPEVLGQCINNMERVHFVPHIWGTGMSHNQVDAIFTNMRRGTKLRRLNLRSNDLSRVDAKVMAECVNKLEEVDMWNTSLRNEQVEEILLQINHKTTLKKLNLSGNYFAVLDVPLNLIENAKQIIPNFFYC